MAQGRLHLRSDAPWIQPGDGSEGARQLRNAVVARVAHGKKVSFPDYKEDVVALIANRCKAVVADAA